MIRHLILLLAAALGVCAPDLAAAQPGLSGQARIVWEAKNRFRLFREEKDFLLHAEALRGRSILESEDVLARESEGRGWARNILARLCIDAAGRIADPCLRDGVGEDYLAPADHAVSARLIGADGAVCAFTFEDGEDAPQTAAGVCGENVTLRVRAGRPTHAAVDIARPDGTTERVTAEIAVRDLLIAGLGDSVAAGDGNPDRPVALADDGFCFRQFLGSARSEYFRPGRAGFKGDKSCELTRPDGNVGAQWNRLSARWQYAACHRSLYSYQLRTALALAIENTHIAVTFVPLACTGATIETGLLGSQRSRELSCGDSACPGAVPAQLAQLQSMLGAARRRDPTRRLDLVFLTVGANDIDFSGLVADVIIDEPWSRTLFKRGGLIGGVEDSQAALDQTLPREFMRLRATLKPLVGDLGRVVYVSYANPVLGPDGAPCPGGRDGFDIHPAFGIDAQRARRAAEFVDGAFLPGLKALATCSGGTLCADGEAMTFVDAHRAAFAAHGACARADTDPPFDQECFSSAGTSFAASPVAGATAPLACDRRPSEFRAYAPRARWMRTANDSYFAAMTYPQGTPAALQPSDIHDATWGVLSAVYGGAIHPTAEGHAAMADAALVEARRVLAIVPADAAVIAEPLPSLPATAP